MKFASIVGLIAVASAQIRPADMPTGNQPELDHTKESWGVPNLHPDTGLAITTTGHHWYGQPNIHLAQTEQRRGHRHHKSHRHGRRAHH